jgi:hypothetical protein
MVRQAAGVLAGRQPLEIVPHGGFAPVSTGCAVKSYFGCLAATVRTGPKSDVKPEMHHIAILDDVILPFQS